MAWEQLDDGFKNVLTNNDLQSPLIWAGLRLDRDAASAFLLAIGALECSGDRQTVRIDAAMNLQACATTIADQRSSAQSRLTDVQISTDLANSAKRAKLDEVSRAILDVHE